MRRVLAMGLALAVIVIGATKYDGPIPLDPKPRFGKNPINGSGLIGTRYGEQSPAPVKSIRPTFRWKTPSADQKVDLIIWDAAETAGRLQRSVTIAPGATPQFVKGEMVFYKEGIEGGELQIDKDLDPNTVYFWSIRVTGTENWTGFEHSTSHLAILVGRVGTASESGYFLFKTPK